MWHLLFVICVQIKREIIVLHCFLARKEHVTIFYNHKFLQPDFLVLTENLLVRSFLMYSELNGCIVTNGVLIYYYYFFNTKGLVRASSKKIIVKITFRQCTGR